MLEVVKAIPYYNRRSILINGHYLRGKGETTIVVAERETTIAAETDEPIVTQIRSLLMLQPLKELCCARHV